MSSMYNKMRFFRNSLNGILANNRPCTSTTTLSIGNFLDSWITKLEEYKIPDARTSVQIIASNVLKIANMDELPRFYSQPLTEDQQRSIDQCCECRLARVPIQYIVRDWDFRYTRLKLVPPVFIPRPETETLIDIVKKSVKILNRILEIGCGSGAISISLLQENKSLRMISIDQSRLACNLTLQNAILNGVDDRLEVHEKKIEEDGSISNFEVGEIDAIVSNPPYVFSSELRDLEPEVKLYEDLRALDGGADGLRVIKAILKYSSVTLTPGKSCFLEINQQHVPMIEKWLSDNKNFDLRVTETFKDVFGCERFISVTKVR